MMSPNLEALKTADNLKWDFQAFFTQNGGYQKAMNIFNYSGELTEEHKENCKSFMTQLNEMKTSIDFLYDEATKIV